MKIKKWIIVFALWMAGSIYSNPQAQPTLKDTDPVNVFNRAMELFENQKYSAAIQLFGDYMEEGQNYLLKARSARYIALCAKELKLQNTVELYENYLREYPDQANNYEVYFELGQYYFDRRDYERALDWLEKIYSPGILGLDRFFEYHFMTGYSAFKEDNYQKALNHLTQIDATPNRYYELANYYAGYVYYSSGKYKEALERFKKIENHGKFSSILPVYITHIYFELGNYARAIQYGEAALQNPRIKRSQDIKSYLAQSYFFNGEYSRAIEYYENLRQSSYRFTANDYYYYGYSLFMKKDYEKAIEQFSRLTVDKDAMGQNITYLSAICYLNMNEKLKARNAFGFAASLDFDKEIQENAFLNFAKLSFELNFHREAINALRNFLKTFPHSTRVEEVKNLMGEILLSTSNYREAIQIIEGIENPNQFIKKAYQKVCYYYALEKFDNGEYNQAIDYFVKAIRTAMDDKYRSLAYFWLGETYYQQGRYEEAIREYKNYLYMGYSRNTPYYSAAYYNIGYAYYKLEDYENALTYFSRYLELEKPNKPTKRFYDVIVRLADCNFALKNYPEALKYYNLTINSGAQEVVYAIYQAATLYGLTGHDDKKLELLQKIVNQYRQSAYVDDALFEIANMDYIAGQFATAKTKFEQLIRKFPRSPYITSAMLKIALADYNLNKDELALKEFQDIIRQFPYSPEAKEAINAAKAIYLDRGEADALFKFLQSVPKVNLSKSFQDSATYTAAFNFVKKQDCEKAITELEKYLEKFPNGYFVVSANYYLASCEAYLGQEDKALTHYENVNKMSPNEYVEKSLKSAAAIYYRKKNYEMAAERYRQLEEIAIIRENSMEALQGQMKSYYYLGKYELCIQYADRVINLSFSSETDKKEASFYKARSYFELKNYDNAFTLFKSIALSDNGNMGAESEYYMAYIYYLKEDYDNAINTILELKNNFPGNDYYIAKAFILASDVFVKMGDLFQARHTLESIIENYEGEDLVEIARDKLKTIEELEEKAKRELNTKEQNAIEIENEGDE